MINFIPDKLTRKEKAFWKRVLLDEVDAVKLVRLSARTSEQKTHKAACDRKLRELGVARR